MPYRLNPSYSNQYYHVYNRGNNGETIFFEKRNYIYFLKKISESFKDSIDIIAYCLMPNHYHFAVKIINDGFLEKAMQRVSTSYTRAINKAFNRSGHLFSGRYKNKLIPNDEYLLHLCRYIHRNPIRAKLAKKISDWEFSSYNEYLQGNDHYVVNKNILLEHFTTIESFIDFTLSFNENQNYFIKDLLFK